MVQSIDNSANRPIYNGVKINIQKPEVNASGVNSGVNRGENISYPDNGIYNAVNIDIDNPSVNTEPKRIYDYPEAEGPVTYEMANTNRIPLPQGFNVAYHTTNVILPKMEQEVEIEGIKPEEADDIEEVEIEEETPAVPEPNYTTTEAEKGVEPEEANQETTLPPVVEEKAPEVKDAIADDVQIMETEVKETEIKRPEIIPGEEILPDVDIPLVISNLTNADYDVQAQQMEEIARISLDNPNNGKIVNKRIAETVINVTKRLSYNQVADALDNPENAVPYIVREVFSSLIDITKKDTANLAAPTEEQVQARKKLISNFIVMENAKQGQGQVKLPYQLTEKDFALANELSPMEQAERNKEYALYTISILAKIYTDEVEKQTGNIVPLTDLPGSAAIVDALRFNPNSGVKIAAIDALRHIQRPEYKEELTTLYTLAQADSNPQVSMAAERALNRSNV